MVPQASQEWFLSTETGVNWTQLGVIPKWNITTQNNIFIAIDVQGLHKCRDDEKRGRKSKTFHQWIFSISPLHTKTTWIYDDSNDQYLFSIYCLSDTVIVICDHYLILTVIQQLIKVVGTHSSQNIKMYFKSLKNLSGFIMELVKYFLNSN